jgi:hypothetical protein
MSPLASLAQSEGLPLTSRSYDSFFLQARELALRRIAHDQVPRRRLAGRVAQRVDVALQQVDARRAVDAEDRPVGHGEVHGDLRVAEPVDGARVAHVRPVALHHPRARLHDEVAVQRVGIEHGDGGVAARGVEADGGDVLAVGRQHHRGVGRRMQEGREQRIVGGRGLAGRAQVQRRLAGARQQRQAGERGGRRGAQELLHGFLLPSADV